MNVRICNLLSGDLGGLNLGQNKACMLYQSSIKRAQKLGGI